MLVESLRLAHFRNLTLVEVEPDAGLNFFIGANGQGKTSILEALGVLGSLRSFREARAGDWIQQGRLDAEIQVMVIPSRTEQDWRSRISVALNRQMIWKMLGADHPMEAHKVDSKGIYARGKSADVKEGVVAFLEKRPARFPMKVSDGMPSYFPWWTERPFK